MSTDTRSTIKTGSEEDPELLRHLASLELASIAEYREWCGAHGFSRRLHKHWRERGRERAEFSRAVAEARIAQKKRLTRNPAKLIQAIFEGTVTNGEVADPLLLEIQRLQS